MVIPDRKISSKSLSDLIPNGSIIAFNGTFLVQYTSYVIAFLLVTIELEGILHFV